MIHALNHFLMFLDFRIYQFNGTRRQSFDICWTKADVCIAMKQYISLKNVN